MDGLHIRNLMFTYFFRFFEQVVPDQHLYVFGDAALPRCLRTATSNKQETIYCYSETERDAASAKLGGKPEITRFKGLGEISPAKFKQFIGKEMRVSQVEYASRSRGMDSQQILTFYMGKNTPERNPDASGIMENLVVPVEE